MLERTCKEERQFPKTENGPKKLHPFCLRDFVLPCVLVGSDKSSVLSFPFGQRYSKFSWWVFSPRQIPKYIQKSVYCDSFWEAGRIFLKGYMFETQFHGLWHSFSNFLTLFCHLCPEISQMQNNILVIQVCLPLNIPSGIGTLFHESCTLRKSLQNWIPTEDTSGLAALSLKRPLWWKRAVAEQASLLYKSEKSN